MSQQRSQLPQQLQGIYSQLNEIRSTLTKMKGKCKDASELTKIQERLVELENKECHDGIWAGHREKGEIPEGQGVINDLCEDCHSIEQQIIQSLNERETTSSV